MRDVHVKLIQDYCGKRSISKDFFDQQIGLKFKEGTSKVLHLERSFVWCWNLGTSESRSEILGKVWNMILEKDGEDQLDRSCEKLSITQNQGG
jgi:hypothetical protein